MTRRIVIEFDPEAQALMERVKEAIIGRNVERAKKGDFASVEAATYKSIVQRGVAAVAREILADI